jgi:preprotein translocase subunit SecG
MVTFLTIVHISVCIFLVLVVLLQHGKGADIGATFGGASQTVFGTGGAATFISKVTVVMAATFMVTSMALAYFASRTARESLFSKEAKTATEQKAPAAATEAAPAPVGGADPAVPGNTENAPVPAK